MVRGCSCNCSQAYGSDIAGRPATFAVPAVRRRIAVPLCTRSSAQRGMKRGMPEVLFYHLERTTLEKALPDLLLRTLARGWRAVLKVGSDERLEALNAHLWSFDDSSFLPHGSAADGHATLQ